MARRVATTAARLLIRRPVAVPTPFGFRFTLVPEDPRSLKVASGLYERDDVALFRSLQLERGAVVDVGANVGFFTLLFASLYPQCTVHAIEPNPYCVQRLGQNRDANPKLADRIRIHGCAVGDQPASVSLTTYPGAQGHPWGRIGTTAKEGTVSYEVEQKRLDDLVEGPVSLLKIDVEGYELSVLEGARRIIEQYRPRIVFEISLSFLIERPGVYQRELAFAAEHRYRPMVARGGRLVPYEWPFARVFNMWLTPDEAKAATAAAPASAETLDARPATPVSM